MSYKTKDISHENGVYWVLKDREAGVYWVFKTGVTHSTSDSSYTLDDDGLSLAIARCDYLAGREIARRLTS